METPEIRHGSVEGDGARRRARRPAARPDVDELLATADDLDRQADDIEAGGRVTKRLVAQAIAALDRLSERARARHRSRHAAT